MLEAGIEPYLVGFPRTHSLAEVRTTWPDLAPDEHTGEKVGVTGRVMFLRTGGKLCFATLREGDGTQLQVMLSEAQVGEESLADWKAYVDLGDHVGITGEVISSRRGELSVLADSWAITAKALAPVAQRLRGSAGLGGPARAPPLRGPDRETRSAHDGAPAAGGRAVRCVSRSTHRGFIEVETPMLQTLQGGATARPFVTHSNAFDLDLFLRIAPELYLKRCVVGGLEQVFEINRNFRNEGADSTHSPEFAMLEAYQAYGDYDSIAVLTRDLVQEAALAAFGTLQVSLPDGVRPRPVRHLGLGDCLRLAVRGDRRGGHAGDAAEAAARARRRGRALASPPDAVPGRLVEELFEHHVLDSFDGPTFVRDFPVDTSPLVRAPPAARRASWRSGTCTSTGSSSPPATTELVDPVVQRERLVEQARLRTGGDVEAMPLDEDFLRAMEHGMPPMGGMGMGDRPAAHGPDRAGHPRDDPVPHRQARGLTVTGRRPSTASSYVRPARATSPRSARSSTPTPTTGGCSTRRQSRSTRTSRSSSSLPRATRSSGAARCTSCGRTSPRCVRLPSPRSGRAGVSALRCCRALVERAARLGIRRVFCLTFETRFFAGAWLRGDCRRTRQPGGLQAALAVL